MEKLSQLTTENYHTAEATIIYGYSLLSCSLTEQRLYSELIYYLTQRGVKAHHCYVRVAFASCDDDKQASSFSKRPVEATQKEKKNEALQIDKGTWVSFDVDFICRGERMRVMKTVFFGNPCPKRAQALYHVVKNALQQARAIFTAAFLPSSHIDANTSTTPHQVSWHNLHTSTATDKKNALQKVECRLENLTLLTNITDVIRTDKDDMPSPNATWTTTLPRNEVHSFSIKVHFSSLPHLVIGMNEVVMATKNKLIFFNQFGDDILEFD